MPFALFLRSRYPWGWDPVGRPEWSFLIIRYRDRTELERVARLLATRDLAAGDDVPFPGHWPKPAYGGRFTLVWTTEGQDDFSVKMEHGGPHDVPPNGFYGMYDAGEIVEHFAFLDSAVQRRRVVHRFEFTGSARIQKSLFVRFEGRLVRIPAQFWLETERWWQRLEDAFLHSLPDPILHRSTRWGSDAGDVWRGWLRVTVAVLDVPPVPQPVEYVGPASVCNARDGSFFLGGGPGKELADVVLEIWDRDAGPLAHRHRRWVQGRLRLTIDVLEDRR